MPNMKMGPRYARTGTVRATVREDSVSDIISELRSWLPNYDQGPKSYPTLIMRVLAAMPGGDEAEDVGFEPITKDMGWHEADLLGRMLESIQNKDDVEKIVRALLSDDEPEEEAPSPRRAAGAVIGKNGNRVVPFGSWKEVLAYAQTGKPLYYKAPMDNQATRLNPSSAYPTPQANSYEARARSIKIWPSGSIGRGRNRTADPFTADSGHLDRFFQRG